MVCLVFFVFFFVLKSILSSIMLDKHIPSTVLLEYTSFKIEIGMTWTMIVGGPDVITHH